MHVQTCTSSTELLWLEYRIPHSIFYTQSYLVFKLHINRILYHFDWDEFINMRAWYLHLATVQDISCHKESSVCRIIRQDPSSGTSWFNNKIKIKLIKSVSLSNRITSNPIHVDGNLRTFIDMKQMLKSTKHKDQLMNRDSKKDQVEYRW